MTKEEMAKEYVDNLLNKDDSELDKFLDENLGDLKLTAKQAGVLLGIIKGVGTSSFLAGLKAGEEKANEVHDMLENPHDTPNDNEEVIVSGRTGLVKAVAVFHRRLDGTFFWTSMDELIENHSEGLFKWCRIPDFFSGEVK